MKIYTFLFWVALCMFGQPSVAQKGFDFTLGGGAHLTPIPGPWASSAYFQGEMEYHHTPRLSFSAGIMTTNYTYPGSEASITTPNGTVVSVLYDRLQGTELQSNFLAKYALVKKEFFALRAGAGIGLVSYSKQVIINLGFQSLSPIEVANTDLGFPLQIEAEQKVYKNILVGLRAGTFIFPDYPFVGNHTGLVIKYRLK